MIFNALTNTPPKDVSQFPATLWVLYANMYISLFAVWGVFYYLHLQNTLPDFSQLPLNILAIVLPVLGIATTIGAHFISQKRLQVAAAQTSLGSKVRHYSSIFMLRKAGWFSTNMSGAIMYYFTKDLRYAVFLVICMVAYVVYRPSKDRLRTELQLTEQEMYELYEA